MNNANFTAGPPFDCVLIYGLNYSNQATSKGGVDYLNLKLESHLRKVGIEVGDAEDDLSAGQTKSSPLKRTLVYAQVQGYLSEDYASLASLWLSEGFKVVEHNIFGLPSRWRPRHANYRVALPSIDTAMRFGLRQKIRTPSAQPVFAVLHNPTHSPAGGLPGTKSQPYDASFLRMGRPDKLKWTNFELRFVEKVASLNPGKRYLLTSVGFPFDSKSPGLKNLDIVYLPYQKDVEAIFSSHSHYLHHSRIGETYGNTIAEALRRDLHIIVTADLKRDCGHLDYLTRQNATLGTPKGLLKAAASFPFFVSPIAKGTPDRITDFDSFLHQLWNDRQIEKFCWKDFEAHFRAARKKVSFGRPPSILAIVSQEFAKVAKNWKQVDPPMPQSSFPRVGEERNLATE